VGGFVGVEVVAGFRYFRQVRRPLGERVEERGEAAAERADVVLDAGRDLRVVRAGDQAVALQLAQALGEHLRRDHPDPPLQLDEPLPPVLVQRPQDRRRPPAEDQVHDRRDRTGCDRIDCCVLLHKPNTIL